MNDELILVIDDDEELELQLDDDSPMDLNIGNEVIQVFIKDYNRLDNKPSINGVTLQGNIQIMDLFPNGLVIDGKDAEGVDS